MNTIRNLRYRSFLGLALLATCLVPASLSAQSVFVGHFTLPVETMWGAAILPAGEYSFTMKSLASPGTITVNGEHSKVMINVSAGVRERAGSGQSVLVIVRRNGRAAIARVYLEPLGATFYYGSQKGDSQFLAEGPKLLERLPVRIEGK